MSSRGDENNASTMPLSPAAGTAEQIAMLQLELAKATEESKLLRDHSRALTKELAEEKQAFAKATEKLATEITALLRSSGKAERSSRPSLAGMLEGMEKHPVAVLVKWLVGGVSAAVVVMTAIQIQADLSDRKQERIDNAVTKLLARASGDTGKAQALNHLISVGLPIGGLDLSCAAIGGWNEGQNSAPMEDVPRCRNEVKFKGLRLDKPRPGFVSSSVDYGRTTLRALSPWWSETNDDELPTYLEGLNLSDAIITDLVMNDRLLTTFNLSGAKIDDSLMRNSFMSGTFSGATFRNVDLSGSIVRGAAARVKLLGVNVSNTAFTDFNGVDKESLDAWAWADALPRVFAELEGELDDQGLRRGEREAIKLFGSRYPVDLFAPLSEDDLAKIVICQPPSGELGEPVPIGDRPSHLLYPCEPVGPAVARKAMFDALPSFEDWFSSAIKKRWDDANRRAAN